MNSVYLQEPAAECLEQQCLDSNILDMSNGMSTAKESLLNASKTDLSPTLQYTAISEHSTVKGTPKAIRAWLMWSLQDSPVSHSADQVTNLEKTTQETCGQLPSPRFAQYDPKLHGWRTYQHCLLTNTSEEYSQTWPNWGCLLDGECWELERPAGYVPAKDYGYSLLRPTAQSSKAWTFRISSLIRKNHADGNIQEQSARCFQKMITPSSNETVMRWPLGWSDLKPLAMDKIQSWQQLHSESLVALNLDGRAS